MLKKKNVIITCCFALLTLIFSSAVNLAIKNTTEMFEISEHQGEDSEVFIPQICTILFFEKKMGIIELAILKECPMRPGTKRDKMSLC